MTSKCTLLVTLAGVIGLGCSAPADDGSGEMKASPGLPPPYVNTSQTPVSNTQNVGTPTPSPTPATNTEMPPTVTAPPPAATGTGGTSGVGATATASAIPLGAPGSGFALTPVAGWVAGNTNEAGIQGSFFTLSDNTHVPPGATTITPANFMMATGPNICVSGTASQVMNDATTAMADYSRYWGGGVGFNLADVGGTTGPTPWTRGKVVGVSFTITGTAIPPAGQFRFGANFYEGAAVNQDACVNITTGANTIRFDQVLDKCYNTPAGPAIPATAQLQSLKWQIATVVTAATPFNFCIENLKAITQ